MNYEPNTVDWKPGDIVIHDDDAKRPEMLMILTANLGKGGRPATKSALLLPPIETRYLNPNQPMTGKKIYYNDKKYLHDPARFGIETPKEAKKGAKK